MAKFNIGDKVRVKVDIIETACGEHPDLLYAKAGEILIVRDIFNENVYYISHEDRLDNSFSVRIFEIEEI